MKFDLERIESEINDIVSDKLKNREIEAEINNKIFSVTESMTQIEEDEEIIKSLSKNIEKHENELEINRIERKKINERAESVVNELLELQDINNNSKNTLNSLETLGEDVADSKEIVESRDSFIEDSIKRLLDENIGSLKDNVLFNSMKKDFTDRDAMSKYLSDHNYGPKDYEIYSNDPEWISLNNRLINANAPSSTTNSVTNNNIIMMNSVSNNDYKLSFYELNEGNKDYQVRGNHYLDYKDFWNNYENYVSEDCGERIEFVDPRDIEGIHLGENEINNLNHFWSEKKVNGTVESFKEIASNIKNVASLKDKGYSNSAIREMGALYDECLGIYFNGMPTVDKVDDYYVFSSNGRHRILAACYAGEKIPVKIRKSYKKK